MSEIIEIKVNDMESLKGLKWEVTKPIGHVVILAGMEEYVGRYDYFATKLNEAGYSVYGLDTFGQGENILEDGSNIGVWPVDGFARYIDCVASLASSLQETSLPVYFFCHSMGSYIGQGFIQMYPALAKKIVLCGSGAKNPAVPVAYGLAKAFGANANREKPAKTLSKLMFGNFNKKIKNPRTQYDWLSINEENVDKYIADPHCGFETKNGFCVEFLKFMKDLYIPANLKMIRKDLPIFIISGVDDPVTNYTKALDTLKSMYFSYEIKNVATKIYSPARHEILNEDIKDEVINDIIRFFKA